jgi:hypothetical protein
LENLLARLWRIRLIAALLVAAAVSFIAQARAETDHLIVPWQRIGPIALGMTTADLVRVMGEPTQILGGPRSPVLIYNWKDDLSATIRTDVSFVTQVCALSPAYATAQGVHPGSTDVSVTDLLGEPQNSRVHSTWWKLSYADLFWGGLMIRVPLSGFDQNHVVRTVCVNHNA